MCLPFDREGESEACLISWHGIENSRPSPVFHTQPLISHDPFCGLGMIVAMSYTIANGNLILTKSALQRVAINTQGRCN
jgi:hypothetical protein